MKYSNGDTVELLSDDYGYDYGAYLGDSVIVIDVDDSDCDYPYHIVGIDYRDNASQYSFYVTREDLEGTYSNYEIY